MVAHDQTLIHVILLNIRSLFDRFDNIKRINSDFATSEAHQWGWQKKSCSPRSKFKTCDFIKTLLLLLDLIKSGISSQDSQNSREIPGKDGFENILLYSMGGHKFFSRQSINCKANFLINSLIR